MWICSSRAGRSSQPGGILIRLIAAPPQLFLELGLSTTTTGLFSMISPLSKYSTFKVGLFQVSCSMGADILFLQVPNWNYINQNQSASIRINQHQSAPISINQNNSESTRIIQNKLASISIHQHQSAPISINQNQSASININQVAWKCLQYCESMSSNLYLARVLNFFGKSICQHLDQNYI